MSFSRSATADRVDDLEALVLEGGLQLANGFFFEEDTQVVEDGNDVHLDVSTHIALSIGDGEGERRNEKGGLVAGLFAQQGVVLTQTPFWRRTSG